MATVLIVDDEDHIVTLLMELVREAGHAAIGATSGQDALTLAHQHSPALIISDVIMPIMDGYALVQALQRDVLLAHSTVLLMSAGTRPPYLPAKIGFLLKPLNLSLVRSFLQYLA